MLDPRTRVPAWALAGCLVAFLAGASSADPLVAGSKLCLYPLTVPLAEGRGEARRANLERKLVAALREASFSLAEPVAVDALEERVRKECGGFVDPATGERDGERYLAYQQKLAQALRDELGCSAQLRASVVQLRATLFGGFAVWDGTQQRVSSTGRQVKNAIVGVEESGWLIAFSLWLSVLDLDGKEIAFRSAGIETPVQLAVVEDQDLLAEDRWLSDEARLDAAIRSALGIGGASLRSAAEP